MFSYKIKQIALGVHESPTGTLYILGSKGEKEKKKLNIKERH